MATFDVPTGWIDESLCNHSLTGTTVSYFFDWASRRSHRLERTYCTMCGRTLTEKGFVV